MFRYFALVTSPITTRSDETLAQVRRKLLRIDGPWTPAVIAPGFEVYCTGVSPTAGGILPLAGATGVLLGTVFDSASGRVIRELETRQAEHMLSTNGKCLPEIVWGSYVLLLRQDHCVQVFRGPLSALPCYWTDYNGVVLIFSLVEDCVSLNLLPFSIDWDRVLAQAVGGDYLGPESAIKELRALVCGQALWIRGSNREHRVYWSPAEIATAPSDCTFDAAAANLAEATDMCIRSWMTLHGRCVLQLSGGFDSSIILARARHVAADSEVICVNFWSKGAADERQYARSMAETTHTELIEYEHAPDVDLRCFWNCQRTSVPPVHFTAFDTHPRLLALAQDRRATAILTGEIGDDIFGHAPFPGALAESLEAFGWSSRFLGAAFDYAYLTRVSVWRSISLALQYRRWERAAPFWSYYRYKRLRGMKADGGLASDDAMRDYEARLLPRFIHPWFRGIAHTPAGRRMLLLSLAQVTSPLFHAPFVGLAADLFLAPLASQPMIEAFCRIPSFLHFRGGENGAVARAAFGSCLSEPVLTRGTGKGTPDFWIRHLIECNRGLLRQLLLDGLLVNHGILDKKKVEKALSDEFTGSRVGTMEFLTQLYIESWLQNWTACAKQPPSVGLQQASVAVL